MENTFISGISNQTFFLSERVPASTLREVIIKLIQQDVPSFNRDSYLSLTELNKYREKYISNYLIKEIGEVGELEKQVLDTLSSTKSITNQAEDTEQPLSVGQRIADKVAEFGGSWTFIITFGVFLLIWILLNVLILSNKGWDPYPFILLNLILSCIAALQAPVIMMSQNRQEEKDRERAKKDYMINLKSELEIRILHEKIDHLIMHQQQELLEIQKVQIEIMNQVLDKVSKP